MKLEALGQEGRKIAESSHDGSFFAIVVLSPWQELCSDKMEEGVSMCISTGSLSQ